jgi:copper chaperone CopZ
MEKIVLELSGMSCGHCVASVRKALLAVPGVAAAEVTLDPQRAVVDVGGVEVGEGDLVRAVEAEGYGARPAKG